MFPNLLSVAPLLFLGDISETFGEMGFVIKLMTLVYMLYWLYMTFYQTQLLFGITSLLAGYLIMVYPLTIVTLVILFFVFVVMGNMLQMIIQFSVLPLLGIHFTGREFQPIANRERMSQTEARIMQGEATREEMIEYHQMQQQIGAGQPGMGQQRGGY